MNKESEIVLILGMCFAIAKSFKEHMSDTQYENMEYIEKKINEIFYPPKDLSIPTPRTGIIGEMRGDR